MMRGAESGFSDPKKDILVPKAPFYRRNWFVLTGPGPALKLRRKKGGVNSPIFPLQPPRKAAKYSRSIFSGTPDLYGENETRKSDRIHRQKRSQRRWETGDRRPYVRVVRKTW